MMFARQRRMQRCWLNVYALDIKLWLNYSDRRVLFEQCANIHFILFFSLRCDNSSSSFGYSPLTLYMCMFRLHSSCKGFCRISCNRSSLLFWSLWFFWVHMLQLINTLTKPNALWYVRCCAFNKQKISTKKSNFAREEGRNGIETEEQKQQQWQRRRRRRLRRSVHSAHLYSMCVLLTVDPHIFHSNCSISASLFSN